MRRHGQKTEKNDPEKMTKEKKLFKNMSIVEKMRFLYRNMTVEPLLGGYIIASVLASLATQNLNLQKACRVNLKLRNETCDALENPNPSVNHTLEEIQVQELVAEMIIWKTILQCGLPAVFIIFVGSWSDRTRRRKPCMMVPVAGELLTIVGLMICTYFFYELPMEVAGFTEAIFPAITGGWMTMFMAVFSYVGDITSVENRTLRIGIVNVFCSVGVPIGTALSGVLYRELGSYGVYSISLALYAMSLTYGIIAIKEAPAPKLTEPVKSASADDESASSQCCDVSFFDLKHIKEAFKVAFKEGEHNRRKRIMFLMVVIVVVMGPLHGEMTVLYLFTRVRFNWDEVDFSIFSTYSMVTNLVGTMFSVGVFSHLLKIDDALIGVMSCMSKILAGFVYAFATTDWVFYLGPLVDIVNGTSFIAMRSIISKLVPADELGKVNSLFGVCESLVPLIYGPMYSYIYTKTLSTMPGCFFLIGGALTAPAAIIFWWMYTEHKKEELALSNECKEKPDKNGNNITVGKQQIWTIDADSKDKENINLEEVNRNQNNNNNGAVATGIENQAFAENEMQNTFIPVALGTTNVPYL